MERHPTQSRQRSPQDQPGRIFLIATTVFAAASSGTAFAQPADTAAALPTAPAPPLATPALTAPRRTAPAPTVSEWYGWKVLLADGATFGFALAINNGDLSLATLTARLMLYRIRRPRMHGRH